LARRSAAEHDHVDTGATRLDHIIVPDEHARQDLAQRPLIGPGDPAARRRAADAQLEALTQRRENLRGRGVARLQPDILDRPLHADLGASGIAGKCRQEQPND